MKLEILLATMNQNDDSIIDKMNVKSDIIICNQNKSKTSYKIYKKDDINIRWYNFEEKGVGLNRNNALLRATGDICLLADDDVIYEENYQQIILDAFKENPKMDVIVFNIISPPNEHRYTIKKKKRVRIHNCGKFGAVRIAFRLNKVIKNAISFNELFGGGSLFNAGEDTMFLKDCIKRKLKVMAIPQTILKLDDSRPSTWFNGYDQKYFEDMGSAYKYLYGKLALLCSFIQLVKSGKRFKCQYSFFEKLNFIKKGIKKYKLY